MKRDTAEKIVREIGHVPHVQKRERIVFMNERLRHFDGIAAYHSLGMSRKEVVSRILLHLREGIMVERDEKHFR